MGILTASFQGTVEWIFQHGYPLIFLLMVVEGPFVTAAAAFASALHYTSIWIILVLSLLGNLLPDLVYYAIGYWGRETIIDKYGHYFGVTKARMEMVEKLAKDHSGKSLFTIKMVPLLATPGLIATGASRMNLRLYTFWCLIITIPSTLLYLLIGYYFGAAYVTIDRYLHIGIYLIVAIALIVFGVIYARRKYIRKAPQKTGTGPSMRIAIFSENFYPELSGISDSIITLAKELARRGHIIGFFVPEYPKKNYPEGNTKEIDLGPNISIHRFGSVPWPSGTAAGRFVFPTNLSADSRLATIRKFNPDVIHTQLFFGMGVEALMNAQILNKPLIGTNHTALKEFLKYDPIKSAWFDMEILHYMNWYYERCNLVTAPSQSVFDEMDSFGFTGRPRRVISNPIDTHYFRPLPTDIAVLKKKFGFSEHTIFHAGRLSDERHPDILIKALAIVKKKIPDAMLALAGKGIAEPELRELTRSLGLEKSVIFMGFIPQETLVEAYNAAEMFGIASTADTQSLVMMQAMACGIPVIGVRARALPEYINDNNGFIVEPNDEKAFAEKVLYLFQHPDVARKLGTGGRTYVEQFSNSAIGTEWEKIYADIIKNFNK